jgi:hypothetical protein
MASVYEIVTEQVVRALESGECPWRQPWNGGHRAPMNITGREYRGINVFFLGLAGYESPYWLTYRLCAQVARVNTLALTCPGFACASGEVRKWLKRPVSKTGIPARVSWVRIPPSPPDSAARTVAADPRRDARARLIRRDWKSRVGETPPGVRIPLSPPPSTRPAHRSQRPGSFCGCSSRCP